MAAARSAIGARRAWLLLCALALGSCVETRQRAVPCRSRDLLALAAEHYRAHAPPAIQKLSGGKQSYFFDDEGDSWWVTVAPHGNLKLSTQRVIRKSDRQVLFLN